MKTELSDGEWRLMRVLWETSPMTITQLTAAMRDDTGWTKHTIISMLSRMEAKGAVAYREEGRAKAYFPLIAREEASRVETKRFLDKVYNGSLGVMINAMMDGKALSPEDIAELEEIISKAKEGDSR